MAIADFQGKELNIGSTVVFISGPNSLNSGLITNFVKRNSYLTLVEIVVTHQDGKSTTLNAMPFVCSKVG